MNYLTRWKSLSGFLKSSSFWFIDYTISKEEVIFRKKNLEKVAKITRFSYYTHAYTRVHAHVPA